MPIKGNQFRSNSFKEDNQPDKPASKGPFGGKKPERERPVKQQASAYHYLTCAMAAPSRSWACFSWYCRYFS
jgi:hypothetical protein